MTRDPSSFRDPAGTVYLSPSTVFRAVHPAGNQGYSAIRPATVVKKLQAEGLLVDWRELSPAEAANHEAGANASYVLETPRLPIITYPYEWPFAALKAAALAHLRIHKSLLAQGLTLSDASAFNVQFVGAKPIFIDVLSLIPYQDGAYWAGHDQFLRNFLNPLLFEAQTGVPFAAMFRGQIEGLPTRDLARVLPFRLALSPSLLLSTFLPAWFDNRARRRKSAPITEAPAAAVARPLPKAALLRLLEQLSDQIKALTPKRNGSDWDTYSVVNSYSEQGRAEKAGFVRRFVENVRPRLLLDIGCNDGAYSTAALTAGAELSIGIDTDRTALDRAFDRAAASGDAFLPLFLDIADPSPAQGWRGQERAAFFDRVQADGILALAVIHHMVIGRNIPFEDVIRFLVERAPAGIIEFVPKSDTMVRQMLARRDDIFIDYDENQFRAHVTRHARIVDELRVPGMDRLIIWYDRA